MVFSPSENHKTTIKQLINRQFLYLNTSIFNGKCTTKCTTIKKHFVFFITKMHNQTHNQMHNQPLKNAIFHPQMNTIAPLLFPLF